MDDPTARSHFWVAEATTTKNSSAADNKEVLTEKKSVVGCVGCLPTREDPSVVQLLRLVVAGDAR